MIKNASEFLSNVVKDASINIIMPIDMDKDAIESQFDSFHARCIMQIKHAYVQSWHIFLHAAILGTQLVCFLLTEKEQTGEIQHLSSDILNFQLSAPNIAHFVSAHKFAIES